ncbi:PTS system D-fructose-specific IIA component (F1P-forming) (Frc family) [Entomoplasma freundtii]|uniref:PTS system, fructose-specific IIA component n=1 Tax=Entomoplasma freundtii TaxID=74700 RepID=A0A2K8NQG1_9MOLU|nr:fructose PTS transporter subunit IIA [Entomoplasma freundtii]ATZ16059.1 PTS system, fructose-specific IIA component [Entomoplasma freundtii]TDY58072.1 PTS system D-fructose-specific IIA component (F1P-forming) (Frc family) [Entomoplasma freundtii]
MEAEIFNIDHVFLDNQVSTQKEAFALIAQKYLDLGFATNYKKVLKGLHKREKEGSTGFNDGIAIPHAKITDIKKPGVFVFTFANGIEWNSIDGSLTKVAIALAIPDRGADEAHLKILSSIARQLINDEFRQQLINAQTAEDMHALINKVEVK